jgi:hypothetical protein
MVVGLIAGLFSLASSSLAFVVAAFFFAKDTLMLVAFALALVAILIVLFIVRLLFSKNAGRMKHALHTMHLSGHLKQMFALRYKHEMERKIISGGVARIIAFGTIVYLSTQNMIFVYGTLIFAAVTGIILVLARRHKFTDLTLGIILGLAAGYFSLQYAPFIIKMLGI